MSLYSKRPWWAGMVVYFGGVTYIFVAIALAILWFPLAILLAIVTYGCLVYANR